MFLLARFFILGWFFLVVIGLFRSQPPVHGRCASLSFVSKRDWHTIMFVGHVIEHLFGACWTSMHKKPNARVSFTS